MGGGGYCPERDYGKEVEEGAPGIKPGGFLGVIGFSKGCAINSRGVVEESLRWRGTSSVVDCGVGIGFLTEPVRGQCCSTRAAFSIKRPP